MQFMDIYWYGQACFKIKGKQASVLIDSFDPEFTGLKLPKPSDLDVDVVLNSHDHPDHNYLEATPKTAVKINGPGEYEVKGVMITGTTVYHDKSEGSERGKNTVYHLQIDGLDIVHLGDLGHTLTEDQVQEIGNTDILLIPVGGTYTIAAKDAAEVVTSLEPKVIIPMHYGLPNLKFPLEGVANFLKEMSTDNVAPQPKLSITKDKLPDEPQVVVLTKS